MTSKRRAGIPRPRREPVRPAPDERLAALVSYASAQVAERLAGLQCDAWRDWNDRWQRGARSPGDCVAVAQECFAQKGPAFHTLGQLCWAGKEACYSTKSSPWLVIRYVADAMIAFGVAFPDGAMVALPDPAVSRNAAPKAHTPWQTPGAQLPDFLPETPKEAKTS